LENSEQTSSNIKSQETSKPPENKEFTTSEQQADLPPKKPIEVPTGDKTNPIKVTNSDKLDNKQNNKLIETDKDLSEVIWVWSRLPQENKSAILTLVRAAVNKNES
jgi:hypothetical protein